MCVSERALRSLEDSFQCSLLSSELFNKLVDDWVAHGQHTTAAGPRKLLGLDVETDRKFAVANSRNWRRFPDVGATQRLSGW